MEFMWNIPYGFLVEIPCGMVESTWNIGGKKSPKWVRSQPKHVPCGIGGQGKDLGLILKVGCMEIISSETYMGGYAQL